MGYKEALDLAMGRGVSATATLKTIIEEARAAGRAAGRRKLSELEMAGPRYNVQSSDGAHLDSQGRQKPGWQLLDLCGFANIQIKDRHSKFWRDLIALEKDSTMRISVGTGKYGGSLSIFDMTGRQEVSVNEAAAEGAAEVLRKYGVECDVQTRID